MSEYNLYRIIQDSGIWGINMSKKRKILIRFDDICSTMDWEQWHKAEELLCLYDIKPLIGVVPDNKDDSLNVQSSKDNYWSIVKDYEHRGYKIAMHGYQHIYDTDSAGMVADACRSEFAGHSYKVQYEKLKRGYDIMKSHGVETDTFFAPSHSYDKNTLKALKQIGFKYVDDGKTNSILNREGIMCVPCKHGGVPRIGKNGMYTVVFHTNMWALNGNKGYDNFKKICNIYHEDIVSWDDYIKESNMGFAIEIVIEKIRVLWTRYLRPNISRIYHKIK